MMMPCNYACRDVYSIPNSKLVKIVTVVIVSPLGIIPFLRQFVRNWKWDRSVMSLPLVACSRPIVCLWLWWASLDPGWVICYCEEWEWWLVSTSDQRVHFCHPPI